jgi:hypothetical protein
MFDDLFGPDDFMLDPEDVQNQVEGTESWDTGNESDIFASGESPDIFTTK